MATLWLFKLCWNAKQMTDKWVILHIPCCLRAGLCYTKINIPHWMRSGQGYIIPDMVWWKLLQVNGQNMSGMQCIIYWSYNREDGWFGVQSFGRLRPVGWPRQARLSLSMWKVSLRAGPSFKPMYFIIMSLRSNRSALPSISCSRGEEGNTLRTVSFTKLSTELTEMYTYQFFLGGGHLLPHYERIHTCFLKRSACGANTGSICLIYCMTSSTVHRLGSWPLGLGLSRKLAEPGRAKAQTQMKHLVFHLPVLLCYIKLFAVIHQPYHSTVQEKNIYSGWSDPSSTEPRNISAFISLEVIWTVGGLTALNLLLLFIL